MEISSLFAWNNKYKMEEEKNYKCDSCEKILYSIRKSKDTHQNDIKLPNSSRNERQSSKVLSTGCPLEF